MYTSALSEHARRLGPSTAGTCPDGMGCTHDHWLVTSPYEVPRAEGRERAPWGVVHLKRNGALLTACGLFAASWKVFWTHRHVPGAPQSCRACERVLRRGEQP